MKKVLLSLLFVALMASAVFADGVRFGFAANNITANFINSELTDIMQLPGCSVFAVINDMISVDLGAGMVTVKEDSDTYAVTIPYLKVLYNVTTGKNRLHVGAYYSPLYHFDSTSLPRGVFSDLGLLIGGESMLTDALSISLDIAVLESVSSGPEDDPSRSTGTAFSMFPQIGLRWYI